MLNQLLSDRDVERVTGRARSTLQKDRVAGIGIPFLAAALLTGPFLRAAARFRAHLPIIEKATGLVLVGTGLLVLVGAMPVIGGWLLEYAPILGRIG